MMKATSCDKRPLLHFLRDVAMQEKILKRVQVNMPFHSLYRQYLPMVVEKGINPEICFSHDDIENFMVQDYVRVAEVLIDHGLTVTFHAPFMDLRPGAVDQKIRQASIERLMQVFDIAPFFRPNCIVCHPSFDDRYYVSTEEAWVENSLDTWGKFITLAEEMDTTIALENVYEKTPHQLCRLFRGLDAANLIFCFDAGHFNAFSNRSFEQWMEELGPFLGQLHLHDNSGVADEHLPVGDGNFPFARLFSTVEEMKVRPIITLEPHTEENFWKTLKNLETIGLPA